MLTHGIGKCMSARYANFSIIAGRPKRPPKVPLKDFVVVGLQPPKASCKAKHACMKAYTLAWALWLDNSGQSVSHLSVNHVAQLVVHPNSNVVRLPNKQVHKIAIVELQE